MEAGSSDFDESVLVEILSKLPLKSICKFRCVSKEWNALLRTSYFLDRHRLHNSGHLLLFSCPSLADKKPVGVSLLADEETALSSLSIPFLPSDARWHIRVVGSSNGLVCCSKIHNGTEVARVIWNPAIDQFQYFPSPLNILGNAVYYRLTGFDFMHSSNVYKLVSIYLFGSDDPDDPLNFFFKADVYTQGAPSSRVVEMTLEAGSCQMCYTNVSITVDGVLYWLVQHTSLGFGIASFSLHDEDFNSRCKLLPEEIRNVGDHRILPLLFSWRNSLAVVGADQSNNFVLWVAGTADQGSGWIEQMRFKWPSLSEGSWLSLRGVWKDQIVFSKNQYREAGSYNNESDNLFLFDPKTETLRKLHVETDTCFSFVVGYAESTVQPY